MDKQQCAGCGRSIGTGISSGLCVYCSVNRQIRNETDELTAANARIAELEAQQHRDAELRTKQGIILDYAMRGLRHSAEQPNDGRMDAVRAMAGRIADLRAENQTLKKLAQEDAQRIFDLNQAFHGSNARCQKLEKALERIKHRADAYIEDGTPMHSDSSVQVIANICAAALLKEKE